MDKRIQSVFQGSIARRHPAVRDTRLTSFRTVSVALALLLTGGATFARADERMEIRSSANFVLSAPSKTLTVAALKQAEILRKRIAIQWLGQELTPGESFADIHIALTAIDEEDSGRLWLANQATGRPHMMWLTGSREDVLGAGLAHEIAHVVLAARFPDGMPAWVNEGIASSYDDGERVEIRLRIMRRISETSAWPSIDEILTAREIDPSDQTAYTFASSLTEFFLTLGDRRTFLKFVGLARTSGWDVAIRETYALQGRGELQSRWQRWAAAPRTIL